MKKYKVIVSILLVLIIVVSSVVSTFAAVIERATQEIVQDDLAVLIEKSSNDEKIPVYIWYEDVSQKSIDKRVKDETDLSIDKLSSDIVMPDSELLNAMNASDKASEKKVSEYLAKTESIRELERNNTDKYIQTRRKYSREAYNTKSKQIKNLVTIGESEIIFTSSYAPFIICELTKSQIEKLSKDTRIESIGIYREPLVAECTVESVKISSGASKLESILGLTGKGVKVGMVDTGYPLEDDELTLSEITKIGFPVYDDHPTNTAKILVGKNSGIAKDIDLYSTSADLGYIESMLNYGVKLINVSFGWVTFESDTSAEYAYGYYDKWFDHLVSHHNVTVVTSAGNDGMGRVLEDYPDEICRRVLSPAMGHNVITVGAYNDYGTVDKNDDEMFGYSSYKNDNQTLQTQGVEKPDVVMPANLLGEGTSSAAPVLTANIAQILELKPSLAAFPQAIKAIVIASCHRKVKQPNGVLEQENMSDGITERQGAGAPDAWVMACIVSQGTYGVSTIDDSKTNVIHRFVLPKYGATNINVSLAWLRNVDCRGSSLGYVGDENGLDLLVYDELGNVIGSSFENYTSTEMDYLSLSTNGNSYKIRVYKDNDDTLETIRYGYAYSTDSSSVTHITTEGIYSLKNKGTGEYLSYDSVTGTLSLESEPNINTQQWVINHVNQYDALRPYVGGYLSPVLTGEPDTIYYETQFAIQAPIMMLESYETNSVLDDGCYTLLAQGDAYSYGLAVLNGRIVFTKLTGAISLSDDMQWELEKHHYRRGDCDLDGLLNSMDVTLLQRRLANIIVFDNRSELLADVDCDGNVMTNDITKLQRINAGFDVY